MSYIGCPVCVRVAEKLTILFSFTGADLHWIVQASPDSLTMLKMEVGGRDFSEGSELERELELSYAVQQV